jgi:hypothetical protein
MGVKLPDQSWNWLDDRAVADVVDQHLSVCEGDEIDDEQIQLWLGLREAARLLDRSLTVLREAGERTLHLWRKARPSEPRRRALDAEMIAWLKRCAKAGWKLLAEPQPIYDLLHNQD